VLPEERGSRAWVTGKTGNQQEKDGVLENYTYLAGKKMLFIQ
jgi:hypothetical protein